MRFFKIGGGLLFWAILYTYRRWKARHQEAGPRQFGFHTLTIRVYVLLHGRRSAVSSTSRYAHTFGLTRTRTHTHTHILTFRVQWRL